MPKNLPRPATAEAIRADTAMATPSAPATKKTPAMPSPQIRRPDLHSGMESQPSRASDTKKAPGIDNDTCGAARPKIGLAASRIADSNPMERALFIQPESESHGVSLEIPMR